MYEPTKWCGKLDIAITESDVTSADTVVLSMCTVKSAAVLSAAITDCSKY